MEREDEGKGGGGDGLIGCIPSGWRWWWLEEERQFGFQSHWINNIYYVGQTRPNNTLHAEAEYTVSAC